MLDTSPSYATSVSTDVSLVPAVPGQDVLQEHPPCAIPETILYLPVSSHNG